MATLATPACGTTSSDSDADASAQSVDTGSANEIKAQAPGSDSESAADTGAGNTSAPDSEVGVACNDIRCVPPTPICCATPAFMIAFWIDGGPTSYTCATSARECPCNETSCPVGQVCCGDRESISPSTKCVAQGTCTGCQLCERASDGGNNCAAGQTCAQFGDQPSFCFTLADDAGALTCGESGVNDGGADR
jgi:hypothetical protein